MRVKRFIEKYGDADGMPMIFIGRTDTLFQMKTTGLKMVSMHLNLGGENVRVIEHRFCRSGCVCETVGVNCVQRSRNLPYRQKGYS